MQIISTEVQLQGLRSGGTVWVAVPDFDPLKISAEELAEDVSSTQRLSLDVSDEDAELLTRFAAYRNALAAAQGKRLKRAWSRKALAEQFLAIQCNALRLQLDDMLKQVGDLPDAKDEPAMRNYAARVVAWLEEQDHSPKKKK